jgi:hypothetical protein
MDAVRTEDLKGISPISPNSAWDARTELELAGRQTCRVW